MRIPSISSYFLQSLAGIKSNMAKRIMYSLLPSLVSPGELYSSEGIVDFKALRAATEGLDDLILYGVKACVHEMSHYNQYKNYYDEDEEYDPLYINTNKAFNNKNYRESLDLCIKGFSDMNKWDTSYGGEAWLKIAKSISRLYNLNEALKQSRGERDLEKEKNLMKDIIVELNVFDGLNHNTGSILNNIIVLEQAPYGDKEKIRNLMNAKELNDPIDVFKEVEDTLIETGDIHRFKDWATKLRNNPKYHQSDVERRKIQLLKINVKKQIHNKIINAEKELDLFKKDISAIIEYYKSNDINGMSSIYIGEYVLNIHSQLLYIKLNINDFYIDVETNIGSNAVELLNKIKNFHEFLIDLLSTIDVKLDELSREILYIKNNKTEDKNSIINYINNLLDDVESKIREYIYKTELFLN